MFEPEIVYAIRFRPTGRRPGRLYEYRFLICQAVSRIMKRSRFCKGADNYEVVEYELVEKRATPAAEWKTIKQIQAEERQARKAARNAKP